MRLFRLILAALCLLAVAVATEVAATWGTPDCPVPMRVQEGMYR